FVRNHLCDCRCLHPSPTRRSSDLTSCATPAVNSPMAASFSLITSCCCAWRRVSLASRNSAVRSDTLRSSSLAQRCNSSRLDCRRSEEHTSELQSRENLVCRLLLEK